MSEVTNIQVALKLKMFSAGLLFSCMLLLTCSTFFIYTFCSSAEVEILSDLNNEEKIPSSPEEKSSNNISIQEEYVHDTYHENDDLAFSNLTHHTIINTWKLSIVHFELLSPPPDAGL